MIALGIITLVIAVIMLIIVIFNTMIIEDYNRWGPALAINIPLLLVDMWIFFLAVRFFIKV